MTPVPERIFLDTNVFIIGAAMPESPEAAILEWMGFGQKRAAAAEIIVSGPLFVQIRRVARRLQGKDWAGEILARVWQGMNVRYVLLDPEEILRLRRSGLIPREDVEVYLTALIGDAQCFVTANRELLRVIAAETGAFDCMDAGSFVERYLADATTRS